jgi:hypothetical protein
MKTTVDLPADLVKALKLHALDQRRKLGESVVHLLRLGSTLDEGIGRPSREPSNPALRKSHRVQLPLVHCRHSPTPDQQATPEQLANLLIQQEVD